MSAKQITGFFKKEASDEVYLWYADKHGRFLQVNTIILSMCNQACPNYPK